MILFVFCCKKYHKSLILGWFFWLFQPFPSLLLYLFFIRCFIPSEKRLWINCVLFANFRPNQIKLLTFNDEPICFSESRLSRRQDRDVHPCRYSSLCFLWMLVGNRKDSAQINFIIWAFVAPPYWQCVPKACSVDARWLFSGCPSVGP